MNCFNYLDVRPFAYVEREFWQIFLDELRKIRVRFVVCLCECLELIACNLIQVSEATDRQRTFKSSSMMS